MKNVEYEITYSTLLYKLLSKPFFSATLFTLGSIVIVFGFGVSCDTYNGVMLPLFIHMITALLAYAPGVVLRFMLFRRIFDKSIRPVSGTTSFMITALELALFLGLMSNGISAVHEAAPAFLAAVVLTTIGTIVNVILLVIVLTIVVRERRTQRDVLQAEYYMNTPGRASYDDNDFYSKGHYLGSY